MPDNKRWILPEEITVSQTYQAAVGGHPLIAQTLYQRGYRTIEAARAFLDPDHYQPAPASDLPDLDTACELLINAIQEQAHILVWGDFDVDGQTATTVLVEGLRGLGAVVSYHIPVRAEESHGINRSVLKAKLARGFDLLLTCDTGITEHANLQLIRNLGIPVIVTDHHTLGESLPPANAVVNPQRLPPDHPLQPLPGVGVAYKLIEGLYEMMGISTDLGHLLELVALGIVADVAELRGDNRYLLQKGLQRLRSIRRLGLGMLYRNAELSPANLNEGHIGFQIAPRLNAVGRLGDANPMVDFLTTEDAGQARTIGNRIEGMNTKRRFDTRQVEQAAEMQLTTSSADRHTPAIVLHNPNWPGGVVGIVASRLVERYQKPALLLTGEDPLHGSARSVPGLNITEAIAAQADLLSGYGGHPMAAGLSMSAAHFSTFKRRFLSTVEEHVRDVQVVQELPLSGVLTIDQIHTDLVQEIERLAPFGPGNPPLLFLLEDLELVSATQVGANQEHRQVKVADKTETAFNLIWWNGGDEPLPEARFDLVCKLTLSDYTGTHQVSAEWVDFRLSEAGQQEIKARQIKLIDYRGITDPFTQLAQCLDEDPEANVWGEAILSAEQRDLPKHISVKGRHQLETNPHLIIWTTPPSQSVLRDVIRRTQPKTVTVFGKRPDPNLDDPDHFINRLGGLANYALVHMSGSAPLERLAAGCGSDETAIVVGLKLWAAKGMLKVEIDQQSAHIAPGAAESDPERIEEYQSNLRSILAESRAFRSFFQQADIGTLFPEQG